MRNFAGALAAAIVATTVASSAQIDQQVPALDTQNLGLWFVELSSPPSEDGTAVATLDSEEAVFHATASAAGARYSEGRHFRKLWNGLTVHASASEVGKIRTLAGVRAVYPVVIVSVNQAEPPPGNAADLITAIKQTGVDIAQNELGLTGRGVKVAVMDTGIDYDHPDLGGCFGEGCRVAGGYDFVGDDYDANSIDPAIRTPHPDPDPDDCNGHGTHVSGIIGANGTIRGVAPGVTFYAYRVFGCQGVTTSDIMLAAMERALDDNVDVLNMSIGSAFAWPQYPTAQGAHRLVQRGINVVASFGNDGALGLYTASAPAVGNGVIGVASFDNTHMNLPSFTISPDNLAIGYVVADGAPPPPVEGTFPLARTGTSSSTNDACDPLPADSLAGAVALIRRGTCSFAQKTLNAQEAGSVGVVFYNNVPGFVFPTVAGSPISIPVVAIQAADGVAIDSRLADGPVDLTWTPDIVSVPQPTGNLISSFSSWGLPPDLSFKPDVGAPGGVIRSTLPLEQGGFGSLSGTSMASPHVAGAVALMLEAKPGVLAAEIRRRIENTATPQLWSGNPALGFLDAIHRQGAGMLRVDEALRADAVVAPPNIALGEVESGSKLASLRIALRQPLAGADAPEEVTYTLGHDPALSTGPNTFTPAVLDSFATLEFSRTAFTLGGEHQRDAEILVAITPPADPNARLFGGYITLTPDDGGFVLRVPYAGYHGDYQAITALAPTPLGFPWLAKLVGTSLVKQPDGAPYTLEGPDVPYILIHLDHQVRKLTMEVFDVATGESFHLAEEDDFLTRNSTATSVFLFVWDGTTMERNGRPPKPVPNGTYRIELSVLKALGDKTNPAHYERWTSPSITLVRPGS